LKPIAKIAKTVTQSSLKITAIKSSQIGSVGKTQVLKNPNENMSYLSAAAVDAWKPATGVLSFYGDTLVARSTVPITTAFVYAPGGYGWSDYTFSLDAMNIFGSKVSVIGRYADSKNYATCEYIDRGSNVLLVEVKEGKRNLVTIGYFAMASSSPSSISSYGTVGIRAVGSEISCLRNGQVMTQANVPTIPKKGTIGLKIYAASPGFANLEVSQASVVPVITL
jgi:hypothetical protein